MLGYWNPTCPLDTILFTILTCARRTRVNFCPRHWLLCHLGLYKFKFEFHNFFLDSWNSFWCGSWYMLIVSPPGSSFMHTDSLLRYGQGTPLRVPVPVQWVQPSALCCRLQFCHLHLCRLQICRYSSQSSTLRIFCAFCNARTSIFFFFSSRKCQ